MLLTLLALVALAASPEAGEGEVRGEASLHLRTTTVRNRPGEDVLWDPATRTFSLDGYLVGLGEERYGSTFVAGRLDGRHLDGALRWTLAFDTGELRRSRPPQVVEACLSATSPTGLDLWGSPGCRVAQGIFPLASTTPGPPEVTSNGRPLRDEVKATLLVREASVAVSVGRAGFATFRAGRTRMTIADGLVHDDYVTGAEVALDLGALGPPFEVRAALFQPTRDFPRTVAGISPVALLRADWLPSLFEHAGLFLAARKDDTGSVADLFRQSFVEDAAVRLAGLEPGQPGYVAAADYMARVLTADAAPEARLTWAGASGSLLPLRGHRVSFVAALERGELVRLQVVGPTEPTRLPLRGRAAQVRWAWSPIDEVQVTPWFLYLSGDRPPAEKHRYGLAPGYDGFLGITPFVTATNLFFGGGLSESFAARQATAPGVNGRGVIAPGLSVEGDLPHDVGLEGTVAWLAAEDTGPYGGRTYGTELDLTARWQPLTWLALAAEGDVLLPGDFFGGARTVSKVILAVDLFTP